MKLLFLLREQSWDIFGREVEIYQNEIFFFFFFGERKIGHFQSAVQSAYLKDVT